MTSAVEQDKTGWTPLHVAALEGDMARVVALVEAGADVRAENPGSLWTPLHIAALYDKGARAVARWIFNDTLETKIVKNTLGDSAGVLGAALLPSPA